MRFIIALISVWLLAGTVANAAPPTAEEKAANAIEIYDAALDLTDEQSRILEESLVKKYTLGKEAYALKKAGEEAEGKKMYQQAGQEFNKILRATLTKDQMAVYQDQKDVIRKKLQGKN